mmetsp:Transcript_13987/g.16908  ORF Transcript_13987/g.16908 Transcript_13987/m.16908 type:complete len:866 (+) Transcript_13987:189-2786(+)|eukprot:CAMPEP_0197865744 /NCGR_PEP_ID=MMETSP1438-20131217/43833_1 /TAXON_ID=1461541 /ORGANISM="Pterosperma sp., Strain CCMP1384" /LENGTH=865 /DNA_ID=CAMNT_0043484241 /DNA_START=2018 /DNA_END=4615 /DNA_ORIENTATION=+
MLSYKGSVTLSGTRLTATRESRCRTRKTVSIRQRQAITAVAGKKPRDTKVSAQASTQSRVEAEKDDNVKVSVSKLSQGTLYLACEEDCTSVIPGNGGLRVRNYNGSDQHPSEEARKLAESMTFKHRVYNTGFAGAKLVFDADVPVDNLNKKELMDEVAQVLEAFDGRVYTGCDMNTTMEDMNYLDEISPYVLASIDSKVDANYATAVGTYAAVIRTAEELGLPRNFKIFVQGVGNVGSTLAKRLVDYGAQVYTQDMIPECADVPGCINMSDVEDFTTVEFDIFSPNAIAGVITEEVASKLNCRAVVGAANIPFSNNAAMNAIRSKNIIFVPEYITSAGAIIVDSLEKCCDDFKTMHPSPAYKYVYELVHAKTGDYLTELEQDNLSAGEKTSWNELTGNVSEPLNGVMAGTRFEQWKQTNFQHNDVMYFNNLKPDALKMFQGFETVEVTTPEGLEQNNAEVVDIFQSMDRYQVVTRSGMNYTCDKIVAEHAGVVKMTGSEEEEEGKDAFGRAHVPYGDDGEALYSKLTLGCFDVIMNSLDLVTQAIKNLDVEEGRKSIKMADFGSADAGPEMPLVYKIKNMLPANCDLEVGFEDQPNNDFKSLFYLANGIQPLPVDCPPLSAMPGVYFAGIGRTFFEQCFPNESVDLSTSFTAMHWLSELPPVAMPDAVHHTTSSDSSALDKYAKQAAKDWELILGNRAAELKSGGQMVVLNFGVSPAGHCLGWSGEEGSACMYEELNSCWAELRDNGDITAEEYAAVNFCNYYRNEQEMIAPFEGEKLGLKLKSIEWRDTPCPFGRGKDSPANLVGTVRTWSNSTFESALDDSRSEAEKKALVDKHYALYEKRIAAEPERHHMDYTHAYILFEKV